MLTTSVRMKVIEVSRLWAAVLVVFVFLVAAYLFVGFTDIPVAVVCDRGRPNVEVSSTDIGGHFVEHRIGPCVTYTHKASGD